MSRSPSAKLVDLRHVFKSGFGEVAAKLAGINAEVAAKSVERGILVAQFGVDYAKEHYRVFGKFVHILFFRFSRILLMLSPAQSPHMMRMMPRMPIIVTGSLSTMAETMSVTTDCRYM